MIEICTTFPGREPESLGCCVSYVSEPDKVSLVHG